MAYRPEQRTIPIWAVTTAGLVQGTLHIPKNHVLLDHLNAREMLTLTDVLVRDATQRIPFFALRRSQTLAIAPPGDEDVADAGPRRASLVHHSVVCLTVGGSVAGKLAVVKDVRVSDFLANQAGFFALGDVRASLGALPAQQLPTLLLNGQLVVGVTEFAAG